MGSPRRRALGLIWIGVVLAALLLPLGEPGGLTWSAADAAGGAPRPWGGLAAQAPGEAAVLDEGEVAAPPAQDDVPQVGAQPSPEPTVTATPVAAASGGDSDQAAATPTATPTATAVALA